MSSSQSSSSRFLLACFMLHVSCFMSLSAKPKEDEVDKAIERGLEYLLQVQRPDGSFGNGQPCAMPALAGMACLAKGHVPGDKKYGKIIDRSLDFILSHHDDTGYFGKEGNGKMYSHAISTLFLTEVSGMVSKERQAQIDEWLPKALKVIVDAQRVKKNPPHYGGWRYEPNSSDSDLSCSGWNLMAIRSARLNGAQIPDIVIKRAIKYMHAHHCKKNGGFGYQGGGGQNAQTLTGAGMLCLELCGSHEDPDTLEGAKYLMSVYKEELPKAGYMYYGLYYASQGLFQLGGPNWTEFEDWMYSNYLPQQRADGSWPRHGSEQSPVYSTAMTILAFSVPYRQLPVYQRDETVDE